MLGPSEQTTARLREQLSRRVPHQHERLPFMVLWSQTSGCTSVLKWFLWHAGMLLEAVEYKKQADGLAVHMYENEVFKSLPGYLRRRFSASPRTRPLSISFAALMRGLLAANCIFTTDSLSAWREQVSRLNAGLEIHRTLLRIGDFSQSRELALFRAPR
jgi:hypothetical protein